MSVCREARSLKTNFSSMEVLVADGPWHSPWRSWQHTSAWHHACLEWSPIWESTGPGRESKGSIFSEVINICTTCKVSFKSTQISATKRAFFWKRTGSSCVFEKLAKRSTLKFCWGGYNLSVLWVSNGRLDASSMWIYWYNNFMT